MHEMEMTGVGMIPDSGEHVMILREKGEDRVLVIRIGSAEATSIALAAEGVEAPRPLTHDLMLHVLNRLQANLCRTVIHDVRDDAFIGQLDVDTEKGVLEIDCRSSDAVALALRARVPIYASDRVMEMASLSQADVEGQDEEDVID